MNRYIIISFVFLNFSLSNSEYNLHFGMNSSIKSWWPNIFSDTTPPSHIDYKTEYKSYLDSYVLSILHHILNWMSHRSLSHEFLTATRILRVPRSRRLRSHESADLSTR